jgi:hypothetical protein
VASFGQNPIVQGGLDRLTLLSVSLRAPLSFLTPAQATCNYATLFLRNISSALSDVSATGTTLSFLPIAINDVLGGEAVPSQTVYRAPGASVGAIGPLHVDAYPNTAAPGQTRECSAGNEPYAFLSPSFGNPAGNVGTKTETTKGRFK